jgi:hypothetical protein
MADEHNTPIKTGLKRDLPYSPNDISPSIKQSEKVARTNTLSSSPSLSETVMSNQTVSTSPSEGETVLKLSDVVCAVINNPQFVDAIIPMVLDKVLEAMRPHVEKIVNDCLQPHIETIEHTKTTVLAQETVIQQQNQAINNLTNKINKLGSRIEEQEQYSRRTSLRFNNVKAPTNDRGEIRRPIDTDALVLKICNTKLGLQLNTKDIGRSHPIGEVRNGKISIITRFLSYRQRHMVFSHKKKLKGHPDNLFITENLTRYRYGLLKKLNSLRADGKLHSFWTHDGSIIVKRSENSGFMTVKTKADIQKLGGVFTDEEIVDDY